MILQSQMQQQVLPQQPFPPPSDWPPLWRPAGAAAAPVPLPHGSSNTAAPLPTPGVSQARLRSQPRGSRAISARGSTPGDAAGRASFPTVNLGDPSQASDVAAVAIAIHGLAHGVVHGVCVPKRQTSVDELQAKAGDVPRAVPMPMDPGNPHVLGSFHHAVALDAVRAQPPSKVPLQATPPKQAIKSCLKGGRRAKSEPRIKVSLDRVCIVVGESHPDLDPAPVATFADDQPRWFQVTPLTPPDAPPELLAAALVRSVHRVSSQAAQSRSLRSGSWYPAS